MVIGRSIKKIIRTIIKWSVREDNVREDREHESPMPAHYGTLIGSSSASGVKVSSGPSINASGLNFTVYPATGGKVIEFRRYDPRTDRHDTNLYVVTDREELGEELGQIITKESLCR